MWTELADQSVNRPPFEKRYAQCCAGRIGDEIKGHRRHNAYINCGNRLSMISKKRLPGLRQRLRRSRHVFRNRRLGDFEPEHQKLTMDPGCAPQWVFSAHSLDQVAQAAIDLWSPHPIRDFQRQNTLKPARCHRRMVSGCTTWAAPRRLGQSRVIHMSSVRSLPRRRRRGGARRKAMLS